MNAFLKFSAVITAMVFFPALCLSSDRKSGGVVPGIEVLAERGFPGLKGKRVGLVTNPSGVDRKLRSTVDILYNAPDVNLVALYGPEHGVRGDVHAGQAQSRA